MDNRHFTRLLALVVAGGLAIGLVAFRVSHRSDPAPVIVQAPTAGRATGVQPNQSAPAAAADPLADEEPLVVGAANATPEPAPPPVNPPPTRGSTNLDPPNSTVVASQAPPPQ